jgi:hypothetical protein
MAGLWPVPPKHPVRASDDTIGAFDILFGYVKTSLAIPGSTPKSVIRSNCRKHYEYVATRIGWGYSLRPGLGAWGLFDPISFFFAKRAQRKLRERAEKNLVVKLERAIDPVPCPHCGMLQPNMLRPKKRHENAKNDFVVGRNCFNGDCSCNLPIAKNWPPLNVFR